ncbi:fumarylacetoacetate hydrolase family protein [Klugiella xanthotipulae]|uniref:2-keto-4-pentenoate hydratase/2-oxohepta-3-ene-1,7-dioic acid hydratase in catechol pathway n=1 Tax=Klugiella xanthotipulae TaxID=244735 RepID=A0A543I7B7_9MICO|nr:fumarylacetoacetate hydrolase family protein [Klugiella xanthotipulae]TQM66390.1 2-keto-4-pentenoate hydratase/2-oxohepta-3-ene-1,7-dioic acid hydratase in catechol pathway [Klugiella xanthotipulae]
MSVSPDTNHGARTAAAVEFDGTWYRLRAASVSELLLDPQWRDRATTAAGRTEPLPHPEFATVVPSPGKIFCCGLNYSEHIRETGRAIPEYPTLFAKFADTLCGPEADILLTGDSTRVDWEAELAVVIGATIYRGDEAEASRAIAGYTVANDVSMRDWQHRTLQWLQGKAFDASTPLGPVLVTADAVDPAAGLDITCQVNGVTVQHGNTATLVFSAAALVSYISQFSTLRPGDVVLTGTPGGVGMAMQPPQFLTEGDVLTTTIEGIGTMTNRIRIAEPARV